MANVLYEGYSYRPFLVDVLVFLDGPIIAEFTADIYNTTVSSHTIYLTMQIGFPLPWSACSLCRIHRSSQLLWFRHKLQQGFALSDSPTDTFPWLGVDTYKRSSHSLFKLLLVGIIHLWHAR